MKRHRFLLSSCWVTLIEVVVFFAVCIQDNRWGFFPASVKGTRSVVKQVYGACVFRVFQFFFFPFVKADSMNAIVCACIVRCAYFDSRTTRCCCLQARAAGAGGMTGDTSLVASSFIGRISARSSLMSSRDYKATVQLLDDNETIYQEFKVVFRWYLANVMH